MDFSDQMAVAAKAWDSAKHSPRICEQFIDNYKMNLMGIIPDGEMQIHMIIRGEFRIEESTAAKGGNRARYEVAYI